MYERFEKLLKENNITVYRLSRETGISQSTLSDWKRGRSVPKQDKLFRIAGYFNVPLDYFITDRAKTEEERKKRKDVGGILEGIIRELKTNEDLDFLENPLDSQTKEFLQASLENSLRVAKISSKYNSHKKETRIAAR